MRIGCCAQQQQRRAARGPWPERRAGNSARGNRGTQKFRLEKFGREIGNGHRPPADNPHHVFLAEVAKLAAELQIFPKIVGGRLVDVRRRQHGEMTNEPAIARESFLKFNVLHRVFFREAADLLNGIAGIRMQQQAAAIGRKREKANGRLDHRKSVALELHLARDFRNQRPSRVRERGNFEAGNEFVGNRRAADNRAALEDERLVPRLGEIERRDQAVMPRAENDDVALRRHGYRVPLSFKISSAARRPGAPMIPPPGCVAEPHI